ncbi:major facilitator superfamily domain-containing protein [Podospora aff. communis PSN243]|uniref:Major facilitator superfamily domain-containing protein n=1 Tax=Podospora aff. communis PSN243 TaxID=3040156 RepID=A0AAV9GQV7_9PEZI|nr:major facilitator superfamily domain-containing protein [Podospora aff. communis PSN243]
MDRRVKPKDGGDKIAIITAGRSRGAPADRLQLLAVCLLSFSIALSDTAPSALRPSIEKRYNSSNGLTSLLFVANALGFIIAAVMIDDLTHCFGRARTYLLCQLLVAVGHATLACTPPLPAFVLAFFPMGFGASFSLALGNVFCGSLGTWALGAMHGAYGAGAIVNPFLVALTARTSWLRYYILTMGLALAAGVLAAYAFWNYEEDEELVNTADVDGSSSPRPAHVDLQGMLSAVSTRVVLMGAPFVLAYRIVEVSISGWGFSPATVASPPFNTGTIFWTGITASRFLLCAAQRVDERRIVYGAVVAAAAFELFTWLGPHVVSNVTSVAVVSLLLGPVYPCAAAILVSRMRKHERIGGIGVISAFGSAGGAAAPFTIGLVGPAMLHPIAIGLFGVMASCWYGVPRKPKRAE